MYSRLHLFLVALLMTSACNSTPAPSISPIDGAWHFSQLQTVTADGESTTIATHENVLLFADGYYCIAFSSGESEVPPYNEVWNPTKDEAAARLASIVVNAGTYEISGPNLITRPVFALVPSYIGGRAEYEFSVVGDTLTLRMMNVVSSEGVRLPSIVQGTRDVYALVRMV